MFAWIRRVLLSVLRLIRKPLGAPISFHLAQVLICHGVFREYLHHFSLLDSPECSYCGVEVEDAEHTIFDCIHWAPMRTGLSVFIGHPIRPEDFERLLCGPDRVARLSVFRILDYQVDLPGYDKERSCPEKRRLRTTNSTPIGLS